MPVEHICLPNFLFQSFFRIFLNPGSAVGSNLSPNCVLCKNIFVFLGVLNEMLPCIYIVRKGTGIS